MRILRVLLGALWVVFFLWFGVYCATGRVRFWKQCNSQCSLAEMNQYWADCCCLECIDGLYSDSDLPDGYTTTSADDELPWWTCCDVEEAYHLFWKESIAFMPIFYINFWFWYLGYALSPTSIIGLSKTTTNAEGNEKLEYGPRTTLTDWVVVRHVSLHKSNTSINDGEEQEQQQEQDQEPGFVNDEYFVTVQHFGQADPPDLQLIDIPLKSSDVYNQLQDYCEARDGKWWKTKTTDVSNPTNGYSLITIGDDDKQLYMYRPYSYHSQWKFEGSVSAFFVVSGAITFLGEVPTQRSVLVFLFTNVSVALLARCIISRFGYNGKGGRVIVRDHQSSRLSSDGCIYIEMSDNPGFTHTGSVN